MRDEGGTVEQLAGELTVLRRRVADLEEIEGERKWVEHALRIQCELAIDLSAARDLRGAADCLLDAALQTESVDCGGMYIVDRSTGNLDLIACKGLSAAFVERVGHYPADDTPEARLVAAGEPIYTTFAEAIPDQDDVQRNEGLRALAVVPIKHHDRVVAAVNLGSHLHDAISESDRRLLETLVAQIGGAIARVKAEEAMHESEERYRWIFNHAPIGIMHFDGNGVIQDFNDKFAEIMGAPREKMVRFNMLERLADRAFLKAVRDAIAGEVGHYEGNYQSITGNKTTPLRAIYKRIAAEDGTFAGAVGLFEDVTERRRAEEERERLDSQLRQAQKMEAVGTLAGGIAHDFNNILAAIMGYAGLAKSRAGEEDLLRYLEQILKACNRAKNLVAQILTFSRKAEQTMMPIDMGTLAGESFKLLRATIPTTIDIRARIDPDLRPILADATQMHQVLINLCTNAAYSMRERGGVLDVRLSNFEMTPHAINLHHDLAPGAYVKLTVGDTGIGIPADIIGRIFDPFFTTKPRGDGTGLGLSVVYGIIKERGGTITVVSEPGEGSIFSVYLPAISGCVEPKAEHAQEAAGGGESILFVDDEEILVEMARDMLKDSGYKVTATRNSTEALRIFRAHPDRFDVLITDMTMPGLTGAKLATEILKIRPDFPIILCTGFSHIMSEQKARSLGIREFIMKPASVADLCRAIRNVMDTEKK